MLVHLGSSSLSLIDKCDAIKFADVLLHQCPMIQKMLHIVLLGHLCASSSELQMYVLILMHLLKTLARMSQCCLLLRKKMFIGFSRRLRYLYCEFPPMTACVYLVPGASATTGNI